MCVCVREREEEIGSWVFCYHHHHVIRFTVTVLQNNVKNYIKKKTYLPRYLIVITN